MSLAESDFYNCIQSLRQQPFRDAGYARADFHLSPQSLIYGIHRSITSHLLDLSIFDLAAYERFEKVEEGDWNWITPGFVAFASPVEPAYLARIAAGANGAAGGAKGKARVLIEGAVPKLSKAFRNVLSEFEKSGVKVVVR